MGHFFWPVTCAHMGKQFNPQPSHPGKVGGKSPPPPRGLAVTTVTSSRCVVNEIVNKICVHRLGVRRESRKVYREAEFKEDLGLLCLVKMLPILTYSRR